MQFIFAFQRYYFTKLFLLSTIFAFVKCEVIDLTDENFDHYINSYELVFVNFHADWCPHSRALQPALKEVDQIISREFNTLLNSRVLIGRIDIDKNEKLTVRYNILKTPTMKTFLMGSEMKREYRGNRDSNSISQYIRSLMSDPVVHIQHKTNEDMDVIPFEKSAVIGYFRESADKHPKYPLFRFSAIQFHSYCNFYWVTDSPFLEEGQNEMIAFKTYRSWSQTEYNFVFNTSDELENWSAFQCIPHVRDITFEHAEEIIEEGKPLIILFHRHNEVRSVHQFKSIVEKELQNQTFFVNFVTAEGETFAHPLLQINKTLEDLPLVAADTYEHMYIFPNYQDINKTHVLLQFVEDMKSGKLHRQYHGWSEPEQSADEKTEMTNSEGDAPGTIRDEWLKPITTSVFNKLSPSRFRYSFAKHRGRDEL